MPYKHLQTHHQASGFAGAPLIRAIQGSEAFVEHRPVDHLGQPVEFVIAVDDVVQLQSEQVELGLIRKGSFFTPKLQGIDYEL